MKLNPTEGYDTARYTLRALLTVMDNASIFDEEGPDTVNMNGLQSWATRLRQTINDTEVSWHIVADESGLVDISRSVSFLTADGQPINHTTLLRTVDLAETGRTGLSSLICSIIIGANSVPMKSRKESDEWVKVASEDAAYIFRTGIHHMIVRGNEHQSVAWAMMDESDRFDLIQSFAELAVGHGLGRHKETWVKVGVAFDSADVYHDAFVDTATRLMGSITPTTAS